MAEDLPAPAQPDRFDARLVARLAACQALVAAGVPRRQVRSRPIALDSGPTMRYITHKLQL